MKHFTMTLCLLCIFLLLGLETGICDDASKSANLLFERPSLSIDEIFQRIEKKYGSGFSAHFDQTSTLKAMQITDTAAGRAFFKYPGKMRWEYEAPEKQDIITDGTTVWIYRPEEKQVMTGKASSYFGDGKGASFLSDIKRIKLSFNIAFGGSSDENLYLLKLWPKEKNIDLAEINLTISRETVEIIEVITYNAYGDETRIKLSQPEFNIKMEDSRFKFKIPKDTDVLNLD